MFKKLAVTKATVRTIASIGVGAVVTCVIKNNTPLDTKTTTKVLVGVGSFVLGGMINDAASNYTDKQIDDIVASFGEASETIKKAAKEAQTDS